MSRRVILLRHGRTAWNESGRAQGHADIELDATGHDQAERAAGVLAGFDLAAMWSSDLTRATQTATYVAERTGLPVPTDPRLREFDVGARQGLTLAEFAERFPGEYTAWRQGEGLVPMKDGESTTDVAARIGPALHDCLAALPPRGTGLVVSHGAAMKVAVAALLEWPMALAGTLRTVDNCSWVTLEETEPGGRIRLVGYNETATFAASR